MDIYHVYTNGLARKLWFHDEEDFIAGMNIVPVCAITANVIIYCFCLMNNHVHFVLRGDRENCIFFIREYKRLNSRRLTARHKEGHPLDGAEIGIKEIADEEYLKKVIAYVMRNPVAAGLGIMPSEYRWSSSNLYFADASFCCGRFITFGELADQDKRRLFRTRVHLPDHYQLREDGSIFPGSYVDFRTVERIYNSPRQLLYFLSAAREMEEEMESGILRKTRYNDSELKASLDTICPEKFPGRSFSRLRIEERYILARELKRRYGAGAKQIARVTSLDYEALKIML